MASVRFAGEHADFFTDARGDQALVESFERAR